ncbi:MAG: alpha/beta fold hydrolase [Infirmifilum sp.]
MITQILILLGVLLLSFLLLIIAIAYIASGKMLKPPRKKGTWTPKDLGYEYENYEIRTQDGVILRGWLIKGRTDKTVIVVHGYTSSKWDEGYMKPVIDILARNGFNVAVFDMRAHGESSGEFTTLGYRESEDVRSIIDWLEERNLASKVGIIGYSMGGAITLIVSSIDPRVKAAVADSPYIDIRSSGRRWTSRVKGVMGVLLRLSYPLIIYFTSKQAGIRPEKLVMYDFAGKIKIPILIIAGARDDLVAPEEIKRFYDELRKGNEKAELWLTSSAHVSAISDYPKEYEERIVSFLNRWL